MKALEEKPVRPPKPAASPTRGKEKPTPEAQLPEEKEEAIPTAMEMALREAMERNKTDVQEESRTRRKPTGQGEEMEAIFHPRAKSDSYVAIS
jgi:hypothetical protein